MASTTSVTPPHSFRHVLRLRAPNVALVAQIIGPLAFLAILISTWEIGFWNWVFGVNRFILPRPTEILDAFGGYQGRQTLDNLGRTIRPAIVGYAVGNFSGIAGGALLTVLPREFGRRLSAIFTGVQALPILALAPVSAWWFGSGFTFKMVVVAILTFPTMLVFSNRGMTHLTEEVHLLANSYEATRWQFFRKIRLPNALPFMFTALRYSVVLALIGTIVCEILRSRSGLGYEIDDAMDSFRAPQGWSAAATLAALGIVWYSAVGLVERLLVPWSSLVRNR